MRREPPERDSPVIARWETRGKRWWIEVYEDGRLHHTNGGSVGFTVEEALERAAEQAWWAKVIDNVTLTRVV